MSMFPTDAENAKALIEEARATFSDEAASQLTVEIVRHFKDRAEADLRHADLLESWANGRA